MDENTQTGQTQELFDAASIEDQRFNEAYEEPQEPIEGEPEPEAKPEDKQVIAYRNLQKKLTEREKALKEAEIKAIRLEEEAKLYRTQFNPKPQAEPPKRPAPLAPMPQGFNMVEAFDESTPSGQWYSQKLRHDSEMDAYTSHWIEARELQEKEQEAQRKQMEEYNRFKNEKIAQLQEAGATLKEAMAITDLLSSPESSSPEALLTFGRYLMGNKPKPITGQQPGKIQSPSTIPSEHEPKTNDGQKFFDAFGSRGQNIFKTG